MKTYSDKAGDVTHNWYVVDATEIPLGRLGTFVARILSGKQKPTYTPHMDAGDYVVIVNAAKIGITGDKLNQKKYYRHSGYPGSLKERTLGEMMIQNPQEVLRQAIKGMLPKNKLADERLKRLKIYAGESHEHQAQNPTKLEVK